MNGAYEWQYALPESQGMHTNKLEDQWKELKKRNTCAFLVIRDDKVVYEHYTEGYGRNIRHYTASVAKAVVGGLALMLAMQDGLIDMDDFACKYIPQWGDDPVKSQITIRHLASHTSGLEDANETGVPKAELTGWKKTFWTQEQDPFLLSRDVVPVIFAPGTDYHYSNTGIAMLAYAITAAIKETEFKDIRTLLWERIMKPIGVSKNDWSIGYDKTFELEGLKLVPCWGGGAVTPDVLAKIGRLMLNKGNWDGAQLIDTDVVNKTLAHSGHPFCYGMTWRINSNLAGNKCWPVLPWDAFLAWGAGGQVLLVIPSRKLIAVRNGQEFVNHMGKNWEPCFYKFIAKPLMDSVDNIVPCKWSEKITELKWAPKSSVLRHATGEKVRDGSDNWPMTWADDDNIYTAYGDGYGFEPSLPVKLSCGFVRIKGMPDEFTGENIRSNGERHGFGKNGEKCSGLLMVDGVLYLWVRNAANGEQSRLAVSRDYAKTWEWCDWRFEGFGHILFVNYGKNYANARDTYVYMASHDNPSAYEQADRFILMRVPKDRITDRNAYEFFIAVDEKNEAIWSADISKRGAILTHPGNCRRASISYNAGIGRYLLWQQINAAGPDTRFVGGLGIYEAPEPWGPWSTVYFTEKWDIGTGDLGCFPTKWMSEDGKTIYLVFAGNDNFSVRKAELTIDETEDI
jgi:CubicO group peptidase (beta-lactamase class C family)